jgi:hypothetical protein
VFGVLGAAVGVLVTGAPVQAVPFSEKLVGDELVPLHDPLKPNDVAAPVPREPL